MQSKHFRLEEWFDPRTLRQLTDSGKDPWRYLDDRIILVADNLREEYGPALINDYYFGGNNKYRGFRPLDCPVGAKWSDHKYGRAVDMVFKDIPVSTVRDHIEKLHMLSVFHGIRVVERDVAWLHVACSNVHTDGILWIKP